MLEWGFRSRRGSSAVFNTRINTAFGQLGIGRRGMRSKAMRDSRDRTESCVILAMRPKMGHIVLSGRVPFCPFAMR